MTGMDNGSEASQLRIGKSVELKRLSGARPKTGPRAGSGGFNGQPNTALFVLGAGLYGLAPDYVKNLFQRRGESENS
jgi:hypothetical protein